MPTWLMHASLQGPFWCFLLVCQLSLRVFTSQEETSIKPDNLHQRLEAHLEHIWLDSSKSFFTRS